jgi:hypothetical protein
MGWRIDMKRILALAVLGLACGSAGVASPALAQVSFNISVNFMPPALPVYDQPPIPGPDYIWIPGTWAWDDDVQDYYWIPGTWVLAPRPGLLWTPSWWGWQDGAYLFHPGYWGPHVGFYGGVAYGFGYTGSGYQGAYWNGGHVFYNRSVTNITNVHVTNVYNKTVIVNRVTNVSYNGGPGGVQARPSMIEQAAMHEQHIAPTTIQQQHVQAARSNRQFFATSNHGSPPVAAAPRPGQFGGPGIIRTRQAQPYHPAQPPAPAGVLAPRCPVPRYAHRRCLRRHHPAWLTRRWDLPRPPRRACHTIRSIVLSMARHPSPTPPCSKAPVSGGPAEAHAAGRGARRSGPTSALSASCGPHAYGKAGQHGCRPASRAAAPACADAAKAAADASCPDASCHAASASPDAASHAAATSPGAASAGRASPAPPHHEEHHEH